MMALARIIVRIAAVTLLCLTLFSSSASAECAWILWQIDFQPVAARPGWSHKIHTVLDVFPHEAKRHPSGREMAAELCLGIKLLQTKRDELDAEKEAQKTPAKKINEYVTREYVCLPDTIDPRGPKSR